MRYRSFSLVVAMLLLAASCSSEAPQVPSFAEMLASNDPAICASDDVHRTALTSIDSGYADYLAKGGSPAIFDAISVIDIDETLHAITCSANVDVGSTLLDAFVENQSNRKVKVEFTIRPSIEDSNNFVVEIRGSELLKSLLALRLNEQRLQLARDEAEDEVPRNNSEPLLSEHEQEVEPEVVMPSSNSPTFTSDPVVQPIRDPEIQNENVDKNSD